MNPIHSQLLVLSLLSGQLLAASTAVAASQKIMLTYVGPAGSSALLGLKQGLDEANMQGRFLGQTYELNVQTATDQKLQKDVVAFFSATDGDTLRRLSIQYPKTPVFDLTLDGDALRSACLPNVLHILPSMQMKSAAVRQWQQAHPQSEVQAQAWHPDFEKYSALQLNNRFRKNQGQDMDDVAWAGWAAVKMTADSVVRIHATQPGRILSYLRKELVFDGQKGINMNFRDDGQLRQIVLLVDGDKVAGEAPVRGVVDPQDLDSLGTAAACSKVSKSAVNPH